MSEMTPNRRVVVGYDGSGESEVGLDWAVAEAARTALPLRVVVVGDPHGPSSAYVPASLTSDLDTSSERAEKKLAQAHLGDGAVETLDGRAGPELRDYVSSDDLLVVGSQGHGSVAGALIGSVSHFLLRHAACTVVVARPVAAAAVTQVTVGVDGSAASLRALGWAVRHAKTAGGEVVALYGFRAGVPGGPPGSLSGDELDHRLGQEERRLRAWVDHAPSIPASGVKTEAVAVPARHLLVDVSKHSALVVVGVRGRGMARSSLGSVTDHVVANAHCPVTVVR